MADGAPATRLVVQATNPDAAVAAVRRAIDRLQTEHPSLRFSPVRGDPLGAQVVFESGSPRFAQQRAFLHAVISELIAAGVRAAYVRPETAEPWLPPSEEPEPPFGDEIARTAERAADDSTGEAAFAVGAWCHDNAYRLAGDAWFKRAAALAPFEMLLRIVEDYATRHFDWNGDNAVAWMARSVRLEFPRVDAPGIDVRADLFAPIVLDGSAGYGHDSTVEILSGQPEAATHALRQAADRFYRVTADGREFATDADLDAAEPPADGDWVGYYTPNYVSPVSFDGPHPQLWMDWKGCMAPRMARAMTHILVDELLAAGVEMAVIRPRPR